MHRVMRRIRGRDLVQSYHIMSDLRGVGFCVSENGGLALGGRRHNQERHKDTAS
jgi:hypothetical protein